MRSGGDLKARVDSAIDSAIAVNRIVGTVVRVSKDGREVYSRAAGFLDREAGVAMPRDAIFRLASFTKPIVAATALALIERGKLGLDDLVTRWLPDFRPKLPNGSVPEISLRQLLTHTSGLRYGGLRADDPYLLAGVLGRPDEQSLSLEENVARIASVPLTFAPGTAWRYSVGIDVVGLVIAKVHAGNLGDAVAELVTQPLGMHDTAFSVTDRNRLTIPYADGKTGPVRMEDPHLFGDNPATATRFFPGRILNPGWFQSGGSGMAGTAADFMKFLEALRRGGEPILKRETLAMASRNHIGDLPRDDAGWRFGLLSAVLDDPAAAKSPLSVGALEWGGSWGHRWFVDTAAGIAAAVLTNTTMEGVNGAYPRDIYHAIYGMALSIRANEKGAC